MAKESDVVLNFKTNGEVSYSKTIKEINKEMNLAATEYKNQTSAMDKDATQTEKLRASKQKLEKQLKLAEQRTKLLREEYEKSIKETGEYSAESQKLHKRLLESETGENKLRAALEETNSALKEQGDISIDTAKKIQKIEETGEKVAGVGKKMTLGLTTPILGIGAAALAASKDLNDVLNGITTATGATGDQLDSLQDSFKNVVNVIPAELEDIGTGIGEVNTQFGLMDEALETTTENFLKFAKINDADVSQSTINAKQSMELFRLSIENLPMILDSVTKTSQDTGVGVDQLFNAVNAGAPQLKAMGLGFSESTMLIGQMEKAGVDSTSTLGYLGKASVAYAKDNKTMQDGLSGTIKAVKAATTEQEKMNIASEIFGTKAASKMIEAIDSGALSMDGFANAASNAAGAVDETFENIQTPLAKAEQAKNQMMVGMGELGNQVQIALLPAFEAASNAIREVSSWFSNLSDEQKQTIIVIGGVIAAIGPMLIILGTLMSSVGKVVAGVKSLIAVWQTLSTLLGLSGGVFAIAIVAIAALVAGLVWAYNNVEWFHDGVNAFFKGVSDVAVEIFNFMAGYISGVFEGILGTFQTFYDIGSRILGGFIDFITGVFTGNWQLAWQGVQDIFGGIFEGMVALAKAPINMIIGMVNNLISGLNNISTPKWMPLIGGKSVNISKIPYLAKGGHLVDGQAITGEAGPELLSVENGKTTVTPLSDTEKKKGISGKIGSGSIEQHVHIGKVDANNPSELDRMNRKIEQASKQAIYDLGGVPG